LATAREDNESQVMSQVRRLFQMTDRDSSGTISWEEFCYALDDEEMVRFMKSLNIETEEARGLFMLLDTDGSGQIDSEEFTQGCLRLRGPARAIDVSTLMYSNKRMAQWWQKKMKSVEVSLFCIQEWLEEGACLDSEPDHVDPSGNAEIENLMDGVNEHAASPRQTASGDEQDVHPTVSISSQWACGDMVASKSINSVASSTTASHKLEAINRRLSANRQQTFSGKKASVQIALEKEDEEITFSTWADMKAEGRLRASMDKSATKESVQ